MQGSACAWLHLHGHESFFGPLPRDHHGMNDEEPIHKEARAASRNSFPGTVISTVPIDVQEARQPVDFSCICCAALDTPTANTFRTAGCLASSGVGRRLHDIQLSCSSNSTTKGEIPMIGCE